MDYKQVKEAIRASFQGTVRPKDKDIFEYYKPDEKAFLKMIKGKGWVHLLKVLETSEYSLSMTYGEMFLHMTAPAAHYFAPAMLLYILNANADMLPSMVFF